MTFIEAVADFTMILRALTSIYIFTLILLGSVAAQAKDGSDVDVEEPVTIVQPLDLGAWMSDKIEIDSALFGEWQSGESREHLGIYQSPVASNACFIAMQNRFVPGFLMEYQGKHYIIVGSHASESLQLIPQVLEFSFESENQKMVVNKITVSIADGILENPGKLMEMIDSTSMISKNATRLEFNRI